MKEKCKFVSAYLKICIGSLMESLPEREDNTTLVMDLTLEIPCITTSLKPD